MPERRKETRQWSPSVRQDGDSHAGVPPPTRCRRDDDVSARGSGPRARSRVALGTAVALRRRQEVRCSMLRIIIALLLAMALSAVASGQPALHPGEVRHSGRIVEMAPDASGFGLEEIVAWNGAGTGLVTPSIRLTPDTSIRLIERAPGPDADRTALPGWDAEPLEAKALREGDFVTVTTDDDQR